MTTPTDTTQTPEPCPVCRNPAATCQHGVKDGIHRQCFVHLWDCPECGKISAFVMYDCPECQPTPSDRTCAEYRATVAEMGAVVAERAGQ